MSRLTPVSPLKASTSKSIRQLAAQVHQTFPEMVVHQHLRDAAAALDSGRTEGAQRHLNAAIASFAPQTLHRHGIGDDEGHQAGKTYMHQAHRHLLLVKDIEDMGHQNAAVLAAAREAKAGNAMTNAQPIPIGKSDRAAEGPASPQPAGSKQFVATSWEGVSNAIELVGPKGYTHGWIKAAGQAAMKVVSTHNPAWNPDMPGFGQPSAGGASSGSGHKIAKAAMNALTTHNGAWNPDMPGFGVNPEVHIAAAQVHRKAASAAPPGSRKQAAHQRMAKIHTAAARTLLSTNGAWNPDMPGFGVKGSSTVQTAFQGPAVELVGPKGYEHGWKYVGGPGLPARPGGASRGTGRIFIGGKVAGTAGTRSGNAIVRAAADRQQGLHGAGFGHYPRAKVGKAIAREKASRAGPLNPPSPGSAALRSRMDSATSGWRQAIGDYDRAISAGKIKFGKGKFTTGYPGQAGADAGLMAFLNTKLPGMAMSWDDVDRAIELSAQTGALASTPHPLGRKGLWGVEGMQLPPYIQNIARALMRKRGMDESHAIAVAKAATSKWGKGGGKVHPEVRAASLKTGAEWEAKRAKAHAQANTWGDITGQIELATIDLYNPAGNPGQARVPAAQPGGGQFTAGGQGSGQGQQKPTAHQQHEAHMQHLQHMAGTKAGLLKQAGQWRAQAAQLGKQITALNKAISSALASAAGKKATGQKGAKTATTAKTSSTAPATKTAATTATATGTKTATTTAKKAAAPAKAGSISGMRSQVKALTAQRNQLLQQAAAATAKAAKM